MANRANARVAALVVLAAVGVALLFALLSSWGGDEPRLAGSHRSDADPSTSREGERATSRGTSGGDANDAKAGANDGDTPSRDPSDAAGFPTRALDLLDIVETVGPTVVVLERETGRVLPDAGVWWIGRDEVGGDDATAEARDAGWSALRRGDDAAAERIEREGHPLELDALATAELPWHAGAGLLFVRHGDRRQMRLLEIFARERIVVRLARHYDLILRALDANGRPVGGVPVVLAPIAVPFVAADPSTPEPPHLFAALTSHDGEARVAWGSSLLDAHVDRDGLSNHQAVVAALAFPCHLRHETPIDPRQEEDALLDLSPPPMATVRLRAELADAAEGTPCPAAVALRLRCALPFLGLLPTFVAEAEIAPGGSCELLVEADAPFLVDARSRDGRWIATATKLVAPSVAQTAEFVVKMAPQQPVPLAHVLVLEDARTPYAMREVGWQEDHGVFAPDGGLARVTTDAAGRAWLPLQALEFAKRLQVFARLVDGGKGGAKLRGRSPLGPDENALDVPIATVLLADVPRLISGRVVDARGAGLPDAQIRIVASRLASADWVWIRNAETQIGEALEWYVDPVSEGRFEAWAPHACDELALFASLDGWFHDGAVDATAGVESHDLAESGARDVTLVMRRNARARGRLLVDPGVSIARLALQTHRDQPRLLRSRIADDGTFEVEAQPGSWTLQVVSRTAGRVGFGGVALVEEIVGVRFEEDRLTVDPRLDPIDLRKKLSQLAIEARTPEGDPVGGALLFLENGRGFAAQLTPSADPFGRAVVAAPVDGLRLAVGGPAWTFQVVPFDRPSREVVLQPATDVRVKLPSPDHPLSGLAIELRCMNADGGWLLDQVASALAPQLATFTDRKNWSLRVPVPGRYAITWREPDGEERTVWESPNHLEVGSEPIAWTVDLSDDELEEVRKMREWLGRKRR